METVLEMIDALRSGFPNSLERVREIVDTTRPDLATAFDHSSERAERREREERAAHTGTRAEWRRWERIACAY